MESREWRETFASSAHAPRGLLSPSSIFSKTRYSLLRASHVPGMHNASFLIFTTFV